MTYGSIWQGRLAAVAVVAVLSGGGASESAEAPPGREETRAAEAAAKGGSKETVTSGSLQWLSRHQELDGRWSAAKHGGGDADAAVTGLAVLAFLGAGHTEKTGRYRATVVKGVDWVISRQSENGCIGEGFEGGVGLHHAICGLALAEAFGMARVERTGAAAQKAVDYSTRIHQAKHSGWGPGPGGPPDMATTVWFVMQLKSASVARLRVETAGHRGAADFLERCTDHRPGRLGLVSDRPGGAASATVTAQGMLCRQFMGWKRTDPLLEGGADHLARHLPAWEEGRIDFHYWYFGTLVMFQMGGERWKQWNAALRDMLIEHMRGGAPATDGSWDPGGHWADLGGRVSSTALGTLCLETYYRYSPLYKGSGRGGAHSGRRHGGSSSVGAVSAAASKGPAVRTSPTGVAAGKDATSDAPLGGARVVGSLGVGGGGAGCYGFRSGGGRRRAALRGGGSRRSEATIDRPSTGGSMRGPPPTSAPRTTAHATFVHEAVDPAAPARKAGRIKKAAIAADASKTKEALVMAEEAAPRPARPLPRVDRLKGGSRDDNAEWEEYLRFRKEFAADYAGQFRTENVIRVDVTERRWIEVRDREGRPVPNATVRVLTGDREVLSARTYSNGKTLFFPRALGAEGDEFVIEAALGDARRTETFNRNDQGEWRVDLPAKRSDAEPVLDILFCLDTTGSMADEIRAIQQCLKDIVASIEALPGEVALRFGLVEYRDRKDAFVSRVDDFTADVDAFQARLDGLVATGGGDTPESVNEAIHKSVNEVTWTAGAEGVRIVILVADAPPHMDYHDDVKYAETMKLAHSRAVKIYPVAASGLTKRGEYIFRQLAQYTCAKFLFITYGGGTPHDVKPFKENNLDAIVTNIVRDELAAYRADMADAAADAPPAEDVPAEKDDDGPF